MRTRDLTGKRFGALVALHRAGRDEQGKTLWSCSCDCGQSAVVTMGNLTQGNTKSCGHLKRLSRRMNLAGDRYGKLVAVEPQPKQAWLCKCDCGRHTSVAIGHLRNGHTRSCGQCSKVERTAKAQARLDTAPWVKAVKAHRRCDACGSRSHLHAHHIMPFSDFPELRTWEDNGSCLCAPCHREVHTLIRTGRTPGDALGDLIAIKYLARYPDKGGIEDLRKARHYLDALIEVLA